MSSHVILRGSARPVVSRRVLETKDTTPNSENPPDTTEIKGALDEFMTTFETFHKKVDEELAEIKKKQAKQPDDADVVTREEVKKLNDALDDQKKTIDDLRLDEKRSVRAEVEIAGTKRQLTEDEVKHADAFLGAGGFMRKGNETGLAELQEKALSASSNPDAGWTVPVSTEAAIDRVLSEVSPIRSIASVMQIGTGEHKRLINVGGTASGWVGEEESRPQTDPSTLRERRFPVMELYAMPAATQTLLDDSAVNIEQWMADEVQIEFAEQEGNAFVLGDGVAKPRGLISGYTPVANASFDEADGAPGYVATGASGAFKTSAEGDDYDNIIDLVYALKSGYRQNARHVMSRTTQQAVRKIKDGDGNPTWQPGMQAGQPASLMGYPITEAEDMPTIAANSFSMAFGDFRAGYLVIDRVGIRVLRDPFTAKPYVLFYTTKRVGGGIKKFECIKLLKFGSS